jgi:hypothetical protein
VQYYDCVVCGCTFVGVVVDICVGFGGRACVQYAHKWYRGAGDLLWTVLKAPTEIVVGILYGCIGGTLLWVLPVDRKVVNSVFEQCIIFQNVQSHVLRYVLLFLLALLCMFGSSHLGLAGAGALGTLIVPLVASVKWQQWSQTGVAYVFFTCVRLCVHRSMPHTRLTCMGVSHVTVDIWLDGQRFGHY